MFSANISNFNINLFFIFQIVGSGGMGTYAEFIFSLVQPEDCQVFNVVDIQFIGARITHKVYVNGTSKAFMDLWSTSSGSFDEEPWTGRTLFPVQQQCVLPSSYDQVVYWVAKSSAHAPDAFQHQCCAFQAEWLLLQQSFSNPSGKNSSINGRGHARDAGDGTRCRF